MTLLQRAMAAVHGLGKSKSAFRRKAESERGYPEGTRFSGDAVSRQTRRAQLRSVYYSGTVGDTRKQRRGLARVLAAKQWKEERAPQEKVK